MGSSIQNAATQAQGYSKGFAACGIITLLSGFIGIAFMRRFSRRNLKLNVAPEE
jgi:hypothetical protein